MFELFRGGALILAVLATGIMAGIFMLYSHTVMPGLGRTDDKTFVAGFQAMDRAILNPLFLSTFVGALVFTGLAAALSFGSASRSMLPWLVVAFLLYLAIVIITGRINVPLNDALKAAGDPNTIDVTAAREHFNEALWIRWNHVRSVACFLAFACLTWATVLYGRITA
ncbi:membrane protein [Rhizocola hellebori]|uniref:Membrane protein n=1 Tax=Rhizocola hellebori TaxID=1392758 RepID=A0A8J3QFJ8_9ACTN|nr:anthrone oxygenase family protein [Rhizocola hellebori]GIH08705.1 membrane protein [Rhizocola hellebori]